MCDSNLLFELHYVHYFLNHCAGRRREEIENFINEGVYKVEKLKEEGFITEIQYDDQVRLSPLFFSLFFSFYIKCRDSLLKK